jgi:hypothetical protein
MPVIGPRVRRLNRLTDAASRKDAWSGCPDPWSGIPDQKNPVNPHSGQGGQSGQGVFGQIAMGETEHKKTEVRTETTPKRRTQGYNLYPDHPDHPDQARNGAGLSWSGYDTTILTTLTSPDDWTDDRSWISDVVRAVTTDEKLATMFSWVLAAGGWTDGSIALLPHLPHRLATLELRRMLRQFRIDIREGAEEGEAARLLAAADRVVNNPDAWADEAEIMLHGGPLP